MNDPWNPTADEVREWAYTAGALEPTQDFDLALCIPDFVPLYMQMVADRSCPNRDYILHVLFVMVGDAVHGSFRDTPQDVVKSWLEVPPAVTCPELTRWAAEADALLAGQTKFDYDYWCGFGHEAR